MSEEGGREEGAKPTERPSSLSMGGGKREKEDQLSFPATCLTVSLASTSSHPRRRGAVETVVLSYWRRW